MRTIMVMFDTLTRKFLPSYGCNWTKLPNFKRLEQRCTTFDNFYAGSLPCMPARRELHTGKHNFLHRSWGPLEPFDRSCVEVLRAEGVYTHLCTDHSHYWEDGGCTYHNRYDTWEGFRGQEGDRFVAHDIPVDMPEKRHPLNKTGISVTQHYRNRERQRTEEEMSGTRTAQAGLEFLKEHVEKDSWFLQIECFDPHEPFYVPQKYRALYDLPEEETLNWPRYGRVASEDYREDLQNAAREYAALMTMCDVHLGLILDFMDAHDMWKDTVLIVNTDHGFLLGEHEWLGKNFPPPYDELAHLPFYFHVPGIAEGGRCEQLATTVDIAPTLLELFGCDQTPMGEMDGRSLLPALEGKPVREWALFGVHGCYTGITDGRMTYLKAEQNEDAPLYEYTLMPTNIRGYFSEDQLRRGELVEGTRFTNGIPCIRYPVVKIYQTAKLKDRLYDLKKDPEQLKNLSGSPEETVWKDKLTNALKQVQAPQEEFFRLGL